MTVRSTADVWSEIHGVTGPLEKTLKALAENPNGTAAGKKQAEENLGVVGNLNETGAQISLAATKTNTQSLGVGMRKGGSSTPPEDDRHK